MTTAFSSDRVFTGEQTLEDHAVLVDGATILDLVPRAAVTDAMQHIDMGDRWLAPGFIDAQVNGGGGVLLNDAPTLETVRQMVAAHAKFGTTAMLPTLITDAGEKIAEAAETIAAACAADEPGVAGAHFEGPYLCPARVGAHAPEHLRPPVADELAYMAPRGGVSLVTLAPDVVPAGTIAGLAEQDVVVCAGHTDATSAQIDAARAEGLRGYTHLFNAMSPLNARAPGVVGAALADPDGWCGVIADGYHVHPDTLRVAIAAKPKGKVILVTDAMSPVGSDMTEFVLTGQTITVRDGRLTLPDGDTLAGSALDMATAVRNTVNLVGQSVPEALAMASAYPAAFLRLDDDRGYLRAGYRADLVCLNDDLTCRATWIAGNPVHLGPG